MYHPRHARPHHYAVLVAAAAAVVVVAGMAFALTQREGDSTPPGERAVTRAEPSQQPATGGSAPAAKALARCRQQHAAQSVVLRTAARSVRQWETHVEAMNQLVAGQITLRQASRFWNRTRVGARERIADFRRAEDRLAARSFDCPAPQRAGRPRLRGCSLTVARRDAVAHVAARAIGTWTMHVRDMERLRSGQLSPAAATEMWLKNWRRGQRQIDTYHDVDRGARRTDACAAMPMRGSD